MWASWWKRLLSGCLCKNPHKAFSEASVKTDFHKDCWPWCCRVATSRAFIHAVLRQTLHASSLFRQECTSGTVYSPTSTDHTYTARESRRCSSRHVFVINHICARFPSVQPLASSLPPVWSCSQQDKATEQRECGEEEQEAQRGHSRWRHRRRWMQKRPLTLTALCGGRVEGMLWLFFMGVLRLQKQPAETDVTRTTLWPSTRQIKTCSKIIDWHFCGYFQSWWIICKTEQN